MRSLFTDDGALWKRGRNINQITGRIQEAIEVVEKLSYAWGFRFSVDKTKTIRVQWFDAKLTCNEHIEKIDTKCKKILNVMRCLRRSEWGASRAAMKSIYIALIRSVLDYGSIVYDSAAKTLLMKLDVILAQALRLCCGAFKTTPVSALQVEVGEMPLQIRRKQLKMNYWVNLHGHSEDRHPTVKVLLPCWEKERSKQRCFAWNSDKEAREMKKLEKDTFLQTVPLSITPPFCHHFFLQYS